MATKDDRDVAAAREWLEENGLAKIRQVKVESLAAMLRHVAAEALEAAARYVETQHAPRVPYRPGEGFASLVGWLRTRAAQRRRGEG